MLRNPYTLKYKKNELVLRVRYFEFLLTFSSVDDAVVKISSVRLVSQDVL